MQYGDGQIQRQVLGSGTFNALTQRELVHDDLVFTQKLACLDLVFQIKRELAGTDFSPGKRRGIRRQTVHFDVLEHHLDVHEGGWVKQVQLTHRPRQTVFIDLTIQLQLRCGTGLRGNAVKSALEAMNAGTKGQRKGKIGKIQFSVFHAHAVDGEASGGGGSAGGGGGNFCERANSGPHPAFMPVRVLSRGERVLVGGPLPLRGSTLAGIKVGVRGILCRRRRFQNLLQINRLVLVYHQLGAQAVELEFFNAEGRRGIAHAVTGQGFPGEESCPALAFIQQQIINLKTSNELGCAVVFQAPLGRSLTGYQGEISRLRQIGLCRTQGQRLQLQAQISACFCRGHLAIRLECATLFYLQRQLHRQCGLHVF